MATNGTGTGDEEILDVNVSDDEFRDADHDECLEDIEMKDNELKRPLKERLSFETKMSYEDDEDCIKTEVAVHKEAKRQSSTGRSKHRSTLYKPLNVSRSYESFVIGKEIAYRLGERKVDLITKAVEVLGYDTILEMFEATKAIEKKGGLRVNNGDRRRSPGGVFLFIMKEYRYASAQQVKEIYQVDKEIMRQGTREKKKRQKLRKKAEIEALKMQLKESDDL